MTIWISSNARDDALWHMGVEQESRGARTGRLLHTYYVAACTRKTLGGNYGQTESMTVHPGGEKCARCERIAMAKGES